MASGIHPDKVIVGAAHCAAGVSLAAHVMPGGLHRLPEGTTKKFCAAIRIVLDRLFSPGLYLNYSEFEFILIQRECLYVSSSGAVAPRGTQSNRATDAHIGGTGEQL
jgi:hypothetical protein